MKTLKQLKKIIIAVTGFTVLIIGIITIFLPAPAVIIIPMGLTILATEFVWAKKWQVKVKETISYAANGFRKKETD